MAVEHRSKVRETAVGALAAAIAVVAFAMHRPVPFLDLFDLGIHELGHLLAAPLPRLAAFLAGSVAQVALPLALAGYFALGRHDRAAAGFCLAWAGTSARDVSIYAGDAVTRSLPLIGGEHDWAYILGPNGFDALAHTETVATAIEWFGAVLATAGVALAVVAARRAWTEQRSERIRVPRTVVAAGAGDPWE
jgi:hypothetical protein